jgi:hypothetical protein
VRLLALSQPLDRLTAAAAARCALRSAEVRAACALRRWPALGNGLTLAVRIHKKCSFFLSSPCAAADAPSFLPLASPPQVLIYMTAKVSGGKLNPAVSLGLLVSGSISASRRTRAC